MHSLEPKRTVRLWPALGILVIAAATLVWIWFLRDASSRQEGVMLTLLVGLVATFFLFLWLAFFSRIPWKRRLVLVAIAGAVLCLPVALLEIRGVTGDLVPIVAFRWSPEAGDTKRLEPETEGPGIDAPEMAAAGDAADGDEPTAAGGSEASPAEVASRTGDALGAGDEAGGQPGTVLGDTITGGDDSATESPGPPANAAGAPTAVAAATADSGAAGVVPAPEPPAEPRLDLSLRGGFPQFLGPERNGKLAGPRLARDWQAQPPREIWRRSIGAGWSGFAVADGQAITQEQEGDDELIVSYALETGKVQWVHRDTARYSTVLGGVGPRATPTVAGDRVFAVGATGLLTALDRRTGALAWSHDLIDDHGARLPEWGLSGSPLVVDGLVVVSPGGPGGRSLVAYRASDGTLAWSAGQDGASYGSPLLATLDGVRQIISLNQGSITGHQPDDGSILWTIDWQARTPNVAQPVPLDGERLLVSSGYGVGSKLYAMRRDATGAFQPQLLWESRGLKAKFANFMEHEGAIYGLDDGIFVALDPATGERHWKRGRYGHGQFLLVGDLLVIQTEQGDVVLVDPRPEELVELGRIEVLQGKSWNTPAIVGNRLLVRNDREAALYELPTVR